MGSGRKDTLFPKSTRTYAYFFVKEEFLKLYCLSAQRSNEYLMLEF